MDYKDGIYIVLAVLTILSFFFSRTKEGKEDTALVVRLTTTLETLSCEVSRLNRNVEMLTERTNAFNREVGVLDAKIISISAKINDLSHKLEALERYVYGEKGE